MKGWQYYLLYQVTFKFFLGKFWGPEAQNILEDNKFFPQNVLHSSKL